MLNWKNRGWRRSQLGTERCIFVWPNDLNRNVFILFVWNFGNEPEHSPFIDICPRTHAKSCAMEKQSFRQRSCNWGCYSEEYAMSCPVSEILQELAQRGCNLPCSLVWNFPLLENISHKCCLLQFKMVITKLPNSLCSFMYWCFWVSKLRNSWRPSRKKICEWVFFTSRLGIVC